jgi:hypothetical protein
MKCTEVYPGNQSVISANPAICSSLQLPQVGNLRKYCFFSTDSDVLGGVKEQTLDAYMGIGTCAYMEIQCGQVKTCEDYEKLPVVAHNDRDTLSTIEPDTGSINLQSICRQDPCGVKVQKDNKVYCQYQQLGSVSVIVPTAVVTSNQKCQTREWTQ